MKSTLIAIAALATLAVPAMADRVVVVHHGGPHRHQVCTTHWGPHHHKIRSCHWA